MLNFKQYENCETEKWDCGTLKTFSAFLPSLLLGFTMLMSIIIGPLYIYLKTMEVNLKLWSYRSAKNLTLLDLEKLDEYLRVVFSGNECKSSSAFL